MEAMPVPPALVMSPVARGVPALGRTWMPCQVSLLGVLAVLLEMIVMVMLLVVTVALMVAPLVRLFGLWPARLSPVSRTVTVALGWNTKPVGAFKTMSPGRTDPVTGSR